MSNKEFTTGFIRWLKDQPHFKSEVVRHLSGVMSDFAIALPLALDQYEAVLKENIDQPIHYCGHCGRDQFHHASLSGLNNDIEVWQCDFCEEITHKVCPKE